MKALCFYKTFVKIYHTIRHHLPEDSNLHRSQTSSSVRQASFLHVVINFIRLAGLIWRTRWRQILDVLVSLIKTQIPKVLFRWGILSHGVHADVSRSHHWSSCCNNNSDAILIVYPDAGGVSLVHVNKRDVENKVRYIEAERYGMFCV
jgi:hypothetical protein